MECIVMPNFKYKNKVIVEAIVFNANKSTQD